MNIVKKLSVQTVFGTINKKELFDKGEIPVMRVMGVATGVETGVSSMGDWECLTGEFKATNIKGEDFFSGKAFLPGAGHSVIAGKLLGAGANGVEFVFDFVAVADKEGQRPSATGYTYSVRPVLQQAAESRLLRLQGQVDKMVEEEKHTKKNAGDAGNKGKK